MFIAIAKIDLLIYEAASIKDKRQVIRSILDKFKNKTSIAACEVAHHDLWQKATIGISCVSNDKGIVEKEISWAIRCLDERYEIEIIEIQQEIWKY